MVGRLDAVDMPADVVLLAVYRHDGPIPADTLYDAVTGACVDDVVFDTVVERDVTEALAKFAHINYIDVDEDADTVALTDVAVNMAEHLVEYEPPSLFGDTFDPDSND